MHRSRLAGFIIDCRDVKPDDAAKFWSGALGMKATLDGGYASLASGRDFYVAVQNVTHESRVHLDLEAPTGQRFCVCQVKDSLEGKPGINTWP